MSGVDPRPSVVIRAMGFAHDSGAGNVEAWMCWEGWRLHIGCDRCRIDGKSAACWASQACHGYLNTCGCRDCTERHAREVAESQAA